jgi:hypothetical protein
MTEHFYVISQTGAAGHDQPLVVHVLGHKVPNHTLRHIVVPHGVVEQPLHPIRRDIPRVLGQRPPVLPRQITHQPRHILSDLGKRLSPCKARRQPPVQHRQIRHRQLTLYDAAAAASRSSCLTT